VVADTGNPCALIIGVDVLREVVVEEAGDVESNFGLLQGGWADVAIPELGFSARLQVYGNNEVAAATQNSDPRFVGLAGLPLLRRFEYGGDGDGFWLTRPKPRRSPRRRKP
jgi:hypothetical protein